MENNFAELISALSTLPLSADTLNQITICLQEQTNELSPSFISLNLPSLLILEDWAWKTLAQKCHPWVEQAAHLDLLHQLISFNRSVVFSTNDIEPDTKSSLLSFTNTALIDRIFDEIQRTEDDNDTYLTVISRWFNTLSYLIHEQAELISSPIIVHICQHIGHHYILSDQYKLYLTQLAQSQVPQSIFTAKQLFYIKTCSFLFRMYASAKLDKSPFTVEDLLQRYGNDYIQIVLTHSHTVNSWSRELLTCIAHLNDFICACCWWGNDGAAYIKTLTPLEQILYDYSQGLIRIIGEQSFHDSINSQWSNDETILIDSTLIFLLGALVQVKDLGCFVRSKTNFSSIVFAIARKSHYDRISLCAYGILAELLTEEQLKELEVTSNVADFFFRFLERAWKHPTQRCKRVRIPQLLAGFLTLSKNDAIQQKTADSNKISLFIDMCDQYPIAFKIIWALSFNADVQNQLRSNRAFMAKLSLLREDCNDGKMKKDIFGILWNLEPKHLDRSISETTMYDIMISYSHKDEVLCKQIYEELVRSGFRVWIDFDQMHGNIMDAMAQAIERSHTIIICMSEQYRRSTYCRAEAEYAFYRQLKIVPILLQEHYQPDGWLLFLSGQLLRVDFTKHEFPRAMEMLVKELKAPVIQGTQVVPVQSAQQTSIPAAISSGLSSLPANVRDWRHMHVQNWLIGSNLTQMARLFHDFDGPSLISLRELIVEGDPQQILKLLQDDALRRIHQNVSLLEVARLRVLLAERVPPVAIGQTMKTDKDRFELFSYCQLM